MSEQANNGVPWWRNDPWMGRHLFAENREKNRHMLENYREMHVAWYPDGSGIRDADSDLTRLKERLRAAGEDLNWYHFEHVTDVSWV